MRILIPNDGFTPNPLRAHRNIPCPCGSKKKAKRCHGVRDFVADVEAKAIRAYLRELSAAGFIEARASEIA